jgi:hypothetical protein
VDLTNNIALFAGAQRPVDVGEAGFISSPFISSSLDISLGNKYFFLKMLTCHFPFTA